jgi:hypothetical protein
MLEELITQGRLDGAEVLYGLAFNGTSRHEEILRELAAVGELISRHSAMRSAGADAHRKEDLEQYLPYAGGTAGMAEAILATGKADRRFSSF